MSSTAAPSGTTLMTAIVQDRYGGPEVLRSAQVARPVPADGEVLVRVHAAGVDRGVWHLMTGKPYLVRAVIGLRAPRNPVPGMDLAGVVEAVGAGVTRFRPGDAVFGTGRGTFAQYALAKQDLLAPMPAGIGFEQAAAVPVSATTALKAVRSAGGLRAGQRVLVLGAAGGVGSFLAKLAVAAGARVTGVCSGTKAELVRSIGATEVLDYATTDPTDGSQRYDVIFDTGGMRPLSRLRRALTPRGVLVIVGGEGGDRWLGMNRPVAAMLLTPFVRQRLRAPISVPNRADLETLRELLDTGGLTPALDRTFPLAEAADAVRHLEQGRARGKVVLTVD